MRANQCPALEFLEFSKLETNIEVIIMIKITLTA